MTIFGAIISPIRHFMFAQINKSYADLGGARTIKLLRNYDYHERVDSEELKKGKIILEKCSFAAEDNHHMRIWTQKATQNIRCADILTKISLKVHPQQFVAIIGPVGSSKSALLRAIMSQLRLTSGKMMKHGSIAYIS